MRKTLWCFLFSLSMHATFSVEEPLQPYLDSLTNDSQENTQIDQATTPSNSDSLNENEETIKEEIIPAPPAILPQDVPSALLNEIEEPDLELDNTFLETKTAHTRIDLPYSDNPRIEQHRDEFLTNFGKKRLAEIMQRASVYRPYIREQLSSRQMPVSLEFLPVIESDFKTTAVSRSGATGIWQFMENSIEGYLTKNEWIDERRDPWLSTIAAVEKLEYNYKILNSWELALAAYNMGLNGLRRAMERAGSSDYWYLADNGYLPAQTVHYVPKFIAVADLVTNAEYYDIDIASYDENAGAQFTELSVNKQVNLSLLSSLTEIEFSTLQFLNPAFEYAITPPNDYTLRIPEGTESIVLEAIESQDNSSFLESYRVVEGDTLWSLSRRFNTSVEILCEINNRTPNQILSIGTILFLPILK